MGPLLRGPRNMDAPVGASMFHIVHRTRRRTGGSCAGDGIWESLNHPLAVLDRGRVGRAANPSAAVIDYPERENRRGRRTAWI
jgi:hypothetical protein